MSLLDNLIDNWRCDESSGNLVGVLGNTLTETNGPIASGTGKVNGARDLEASSSNYFTIADNAALSVGDIDWSVYGWVQLESKGSNRVIMAKDTGANGEFYLYYHSASDRFRLQVYGASGFASGTSVNWGSAPSTGTWYFVAAGHNASTNEIWISINGGTPVTASHTTGVYDGAGAFRIGNNAFNEYWDGLLDELAFFKRDIRSDLASFYNSGNGTQLAIPVLYLDRDFCLCGSGTVAISVVGENTAFLTTPPAFTSGPTGWSQSGSASVVDDTHATVTLNKGSGTGTVTISDGSVSDTMTATNTATSAASGDWATLATWNVYEAPASGNIVSIGAHAITCAGTHACGNSPAEGNVVLTIASGGSLRVDNGGSLTVKGEISCANLLQVGETSGGGTLTMDASSASSPTSQQYRITLTGTNATFRTRGTSGSKSTVQSNASGGNAYVLPSINSGIIDWQDCNFTRIGDATNDCYANSNTTDPGTPTLALDIDRCVFDSCGRVNSANSYTTNSGFRVRRSRFVNSQGGNSLRLLGPSPTGGTIREIGTSWADGNSFDKGLYISEAGITSVKGNVMLGGLDHPASSTWPDDAVSYNIFRFTAADGVLWRGTGGYNYFIHQGTDNPHTVLPASGLTKRFHHNIFEYTGTIATDSGNLFYGGGTWDFEYNIILRAEAAGTGQAAGAVTFPGPTCRVNHNTFYACGYPSGILMGDGAAVANTYTEVKSNLFWLPTSIGSGAIAIVDNATGIDDVTTPTGVVNNGFINAASTRYQGNYTSTPGAGDVLTTGDPAGKMVAPYRNVATWAVTQGSVGATYADKVADALTYLAADPSLGEDLYDHVWDGQAPTDATFQNAGHDGVTIGAVEYQAVATDPPVNTVAPVISGTPTEGETLTSTTGTWTGADSYAYQWYANSTNSSTGGTLISGATSSTYDLTSSEVGDYIYCVVTATNTEGDVDEPSNVLGPVAAAPVAPTITTTANRNHPENQTAVVTMAATGDTPITWSITGGADQALFGIVEATGALSFDTAPDYEDPQDADTNNVYIVEVTATNGAGTDALTLNITVTDVNEDAAAQPGPAYSPLLTPSVPVSFSPAAPPLAIVGA